MARAITIKKDGSGNVLGRVQTAGPAMNIEGLAYEQPAQTFLPQIQERILSPQSYNVYEDPAYKALQMQSQDAAMTGQQNAMAALNKRGILDSTITARSGEQIQAEAAKNLTLAVPELMARQQQIRQQELQNLIGLENLVYGRDKDERLWNFEQEKYAYEKDKAARDFEIQQKKDKIDAAYKKWEYDGEADRETAITLGIPEKKKFHTVEAADIKYKRDVETEAQKEKDALARLKEEYRLRGIEESIKAKNDMARTLAGRSSSSASGDDSFEKYAKTMNSVSSIIKNNPIEYGYLGKDSDGNTVEYITDQQRKNREILYYKAGVSGENPNVVAEPQGIDPLRTAFSDFGKKQFGGINMNRVNKYITSK